MMADIDISRISKLFIDRDALRPDEALQRRRDAGIVFHVGDDVAMSRCLQLALFTAVEVAARCFPGAVRITASPGTLAAPALAPHAKDSKLGPALLAVSPTVFDPVEGEGSVVVLGSAPEADGALRITFDGWVGKAGPCALVPRMRERAYCALAPVLAAALVVSEIFLKFAAVNLDAGRRAVGLSLWRPDLDPGDIDALGIPVEFIPESFWLLGLGHLGNAYLWAIAALPYAKPRDVMLYLNDYDPVEAANSETGVLFRKSDVGNLKTRICAAWLEQRGFRTRFVERAFDESFRLHEKEPPLALCGFDNNQARQFLPDAGFRRVVDSGLGGRAHNFDAITLHSVPNPRLAEELWPLATPQEEIRHAEKLMRDAEANPAYAEVAKHNCGRLDLAGKSVAVPFVGMVAATLVIAEALRLLHDGPKFNDLKLRLGRPTDRSSAPVGMYRASDFIGMGYLPAAA